MPDTCGPVLRDNEAVTIAGGRSPVAVQLQEPLWLVAQADTAGLTPEMEQASYTGLG